LPGRPLDPSVLLQRFARYGDQAVQLAAGPFALVDFEHGRVVPAMNGIVPVFVGQGTHSAAGSHRDVVAALSGSSDVTPVPPGWAAGIDGTVTNIADLPVFEHLAQIRLGGLDEEVEAHIIRTGRPNRLRSLGLAQAASGLRVRRFGDSLVVGPVLSAVGQSRTPGVTLADLRARVSRLWWEAGLRGSHVFAPAFERPALDTFGLAVGAR
jgi:hypothetical protein